jgi:hypothetical protein
VCVCVCVCGKVRANQWPPHQRLPLQTSRQPVIGNGGQARWSLLPHATALASGAVLDGAPLQEAEDLARSCPLLWGWRVVVRVHAKGTRDTAATTIITASTTATSTARRIGRVNHHARVYVLVDVRGFCLCVRGKDTVRSCTDERFCTPPPPFPPRRCNNAYAYHPPHTHRANSDNPVGH